MGTVLINPKLNQLVSDMNKKFAESLNTAVFTTRYILEEISPILYVYHHEDDGAWQFSSIEECSDSDIRLLSLDEIINIDSSVLELAELPLGGYAYRENKDSGWVIKYDDLD